MKIKTNLILVAGETATGKSSSLSSLDLESTLYLMCETNKQAPFDGEEKMMNVIITDPKVVPSYIEKANKSDKVKTIVIDTCTYLLDMYISMYVSPLPKSDSFKGWDNYLNYWRVLMQRYIAKSTKDIIVLAHNQEEFAEKLGVYIAKVPVQGKLGKNGIESWFNYVVYTRKVRIEALESYVNPLLTITEEEKILGFKYVFQTMLTADTVNDRVRSKRGMWSIRETYIDNNIQFYLDRIAGKTTKFS